MLQIHIVIFHSKNTMSFVSKKKLQKQTFTYNPIEINSPVTVGLCKQLLAGSSSLQEIFRLVTLSSVVQSCPTLCDPMNCSTPGLLSITSSQSSPKLTSIESVMPSSHPILCHPLLLLTNPIPPSIRVFSNESALRIGGQSNGVSALASFLPKNTQD